MTPDSPPRGRRRTTAQIAQIALLRHLCQRKDARPAVRSRPRAGPFGVQATGKALLGLAVVAVQGGQGPEERYLRVPDDAV